MTTLRSCWRSTSLLCGKSRHSMCVSSRHASIRCLCVEPPVWRTQLGVASERRVAGDSSFILPAKDVSPPHCKPRILVSACLLGHAVTYHGKASRPLHAHRRCKNRSSTTHGVDDASHTAPCVPLTPLSFLQHVLGDVYGVVELVPFCPEVQLLGLPVPRVPVHLAQDGDGHTAVRESTASARTLLTLQPESSFASSFPSHREAPPPLPPAASAMSPALAQTDGATIAELLRGVDGVILKSRSPSCGLGDARLYASRKAHPSRGATWQPVDGFFTELVKRSAGASSLTLTTERRLCLLDGLNMDELQLMRQKARARMVPQQQQRHDRSSRGGDGTCALTDTDASRQGEVLDVSPETALSQFLSEAFAHCAARGTASFT